MKRSVAQLLFILAAAVPASASWTDVAAGVAYRRFVSEGRDIHAARIDLRRVDILTTPEADRGLVVSEFAERRGTVVAVNADFFDRDRNPVGLSVGPCGPWEGTADNERQAVVAFGDDRVEIYPEKELTPPEPWMRGAVSGYPVLVRGCRARTSSELPGGDLFTRSPHPRTAVGFSRDGNTMYLVVADGRRTEVPGLTLPELASWMRRTLKVCSALNLDGGGSSAMWVGGRIVNRPSDGLERPVANHLGVVTAGSTAVDCDQPGPK
ncbi:MAG TPA: phosphodiester glycosidase family protein [Thermoanaerobaculia bacterium]|nr:phosphodiester glycosidase family protein [Thermoanaerobaculia bacterium]